MTDFPNGTFDLPVAATDNSETPATAFGGTGLGAGLNRFRTNIIALGAKLGFVAGTPSRGTALIGSATGSLWDRTARPTMLRNGNGRIKQRATLPTVDNSYGFDGWRTLMENANGFTLSQETSTLPTAPGALYGMRHTVGSGNNGKGGCWQPVLFADMEDVPGGVVSLQCKLYISNARLANMRFAVMQFTGTADNGGTAFPDPITTWGADGTNPTPATNWAFANTPASQALTATTWTTVYIENVSISSSAKNLAVMVWNDARTTTAADYFIVTDIKLERGAVCTAIERADQGLEEKRCLDWLQVIDASANSSATFANGMVSTTTDAYCSLQYLQRMRAVPTVSISAAADFALHDAASVIACTALVGAFPTRNACRMQGTVAAGLTVGHACRLVANTTVAATINLVAEP